MARSQRGHGGEDRQVAGAESARAVGPYCDLPEGVCGKCYGRDLARGTPVNIGEAVGVIAAQSIGEPGTQLTMRTFHIGGAAQVAGSSKIEASYDGKIKVVNRNVVKNSDGELMAMGRNMQLVITDSKGQERASYRIVYGARLKVDESSAVKRGDRLAEWNPNSLPVLTDADGTVKFEEIVSGVSVKEVADEKTGVTNRVVIDSRTGTGSKATELRPTLVVVDKHGKTIQGCRTAARRAMRCPSMRSCRSTRARTSRRAIFSRVSRPKAPRRATSRAACRAWRSCSRRASRRNARCWPRPTASSSSARTTRTSARHRQAEVGKDRADRVPDPQGQAHQRARGRLRGEGDYIVEGNPSPHDILRIKGMEELATYLVKEIQDVYRLQGVKINDKHIEVICRQMMQKMEVTNGGDTTLLAGEQVDQLELDEANAKADETSGKHAEARAVLLGITKASLQTRSVFSAASFQRPRACSPTPRSTARSTRSKGLKENVIVGRLIPAGTGGAIARLRHVAAERDRAIQEEQAKNVPAQLEAPTPQAAE